MSYTAHHTMQNYEIIGSNDLNLPEDQRLSITAKHNIIGELKYIILSNS